MTKLKERQLMRLLHGELPPDEARRLERELERDRVRPEGGQRNKRPEGGQRKQLNAAREQLARVWDSLELPPSEPPADFSASVVAAARKLNAGELANGELSWSLAPAWARGGAAAALFTGLLLGAAFGRGFEAPGAGAGDEAVIVADADADAVPLSLAEVYWLSLEESEGKLGQDDVEGVQ